MQKNAKKAHKTELKFYFIVFYSAQWKKNKAWQKLNKAQWKLKKQTLAKQRKCFWEENNVTEQIQKWQEPKRAKVCTEMGLREAHDWSVLWGENGAG